VLVVTDPLSPNRHQYAAIVPSASVEPPPLNVIAPFTTPVRSGPAFATGSVFGAAAAGAAAISKRPKIECLRTIPLVTLIP
jgi:hypothetical protein